MTRLRMFGWMAVLALVGASAACGSDDSDPGTTVFPDTGQPAPVAPGPAMDPGPAMAPGPGMVPAPGPTVTPTPGPNMTPDMMDPAMMDPNMMDPNMMDPNMMDPNMMDPNMMDPGMMDPNMMDPPAQALCKPADSVEAMGPHPVSIAMNGPGGSWIFYPEDLGADGLKHPIFVWGPGAGTGPSNYMDHLSMLASHGFVVISQPSSGNGGPEKEEIDWLLAQNETEGSDFYQKLDPERVGMGGHSLGSLTTMAMADDERLSMYVLVCGGCMSGRGGCGAADIHGPTVILGGDSDIGTPNYEGDHSEITAPVVFLTKDGTGHIDCARANLAPWVAFMRWQHCGEEQWKPDFFDGGEYCATPWECKSKGFM